MRTRLLAHHAAVGPAGGVMSARRAAPNAGNSRAEPSERESKSQLMSLDDVVLLRLFLEQPLDSQA
jgi:hypothetical protein